MNEQNESGKVWCNDPLKEMKNTYAAIRAIHQISVEARIKCWWLHDLYVKHPEIQDQIITGMFQRLGLAIQDAAKKSRTHITLEKTKHGDDQLLQLSAIVISQSELYNYLKIVYEDGLKTGFENGQHYAKHLMEKGKTMLVMNQPKICEDKTCAAKFYYLKNQETNKFIPVDLESLSADEIKKLEKFDAVYYDKTRHVSHYKTCKNPNRFSKKKK